MKYRVRYVFDGYGDVEIEANSLEEARDKFFDGDFSEEKERGENYTVEEIEEIANK